MSVSYFVRYDITAAEAERFVERYREVHVPLLARWPGIRRVMLHTPLDWRDPFTVNRGRTVLLAQLEFESVESMEAALQSGARAAAREDFKQFPPYEGSVVHQAMAQDEVFRAPWVDGNEEGA
ncbi:MAG TPA: EthD family reductase [Burkholderiales bacterium]|jgi:uncharacterized protein (TIGR02118 family)